MPDLDQLGEHVRADISRVVLAGGGPDPVGGRPPYPPPPDRHGGRGRRGPCRDCRRRAGAARRPDAAGRPAGGRLVVDAESERVAGHQWPPSTEPAQTSTIPAIALLTTADLRPAFTMADNAFDAPDSANPFLGCAPDGLPGHLPEAALGEAFHSDGPQMQALLGGESIMRYGVGVAHQTVEAIDQLVGGACGADYHVISRSIGGDESILLETTSVATVSAAGGARDRALLRDRPPR